MKFLCSVLLLLAAVPAVAQQQDGRVAVRVSTPADAVNWATQDIAQLPEAVRPHVRYLWDPSGNPKTGQIISLCLNMAVSQASIPLRPSLVLGSNNQLWRIDLRQCCPQEEDYIRVRDLLEELDVQEPYFHIVQEIQEFEEVTEQVRVQVEPYLARDGKVYDYKFEKRTVRKPKLTGTQTATYPMHVQPGMDTLSAAMLTNNPIMRYDWWAVKCLTTIDGGIYYGLLNVQKTREIDGKKVTAQAQWLAWLGADENQIAKLRSDNRAIVFRSGIAQRRPRMIELYFGTAARPVDGIPLISMTHDVFPEDIDPRQHPIRNLTSFYDVTTQTFKDRAREAIGVRQNGWPTYALFDQNGELVDVVPDKVARDNVPHPFDARLQPGLSCIRCHFPDDGWKPLRNDVGQLLRARQDGLRLDVFDDLDSSEGVYDTLDRLAGQFSATDLQIDNAFRVSSNAISQAVFRSTKFPELRVEGATIPEIGEAVRQLYAAYVFEPVTPQKALREMGFQVREDLAVELFNQVCPPLPANQYGFSPEDPLIGSLRVWSTEHPLNLSRFEWEQIYADVMVRVATAASQRQGGNQ